VILEPARFQVIVDGPSHPANSDQVQAVSLRVEQFSGQGAPSS
jgi:hypothetical protein